MIEAATYEDVSPEERMQFGVVALLTGWSRKDIRVSNRHNDTLADHVCEHLNTVGNKVETEVDENDLRYNVYQLSFGKVVLTDDNVGVFFNVRDQELLTNFIMEMTYG